MPFLKRDEIIRLLGAASDPVRLEIIFLLSCQDQLNVGEISSHFSISRPAISHHLKVLKDAGILHSEKNGQEVYYRVDHGNMSEKLQILINTIERCRVLKIPPE